MVTTKKPEPKSNTPKKRDTPKKRETLEQKFQRILSEPVGAPFPKLTKREARYFLRRLAGNDPDAKPGDQVMREFYGLDDDYAEIR